MDIETRSTLTKKLFPNRFYDNFFISEYGKLEALRATRYNTNFSLIVVTIDGFGEQELVEDRDGLEFLKKAAVTVVDSIRNCDIAGLSDDRQVQIILPETDYFGSLIALRKLSKALNTLAMKEKSPVRLYFSQATFPKDGRGYGELLSTALKRAVEKRGSLWERHGFKGKLFWEIIGELSGKSYKGFENSSFEAGAGQDISEFFIDQINELIIKELIRTPQKRGILYFASKTIAASQPFLKSLASAPTMATKIFLVGEAERDVLDIKNATPIFLDDPRLRETFFTFFLNEDSGYAIICKESWGATYSCFHSSDKYLVEGLIAKFQSEYTLQEQLG